MNQKRISSRLVLAVLTIFLISHFAALQAQDVASFSDLEVRYVKDNERELDQDDAVLMLDGKARRLQVRTTKRPLDVSYDDIEKIVVDVNTHGKKAGFGASFLGMMAGGLLFGGMIATSIDKPFDNDHFVHLEIKKPGGGTSGYLLDVGKNSVPQVLKALKDTFGERIAIPVYDGTVEKKERKDVLPKDLRLTARGTDKQHPLPETRADKALVVVATPATIFPANRPEKRMLAGAFLYANDKLMGYNGPGTYTFFYLDPGEYILMSVARDAVGLKMTLEAGKEYHLTQTLYTKGIFLKTFLVRHSRELVMFEIGGSLWADWSLKEEKES